MTTIIADKPATHAPPKGCAIFQRNYLGGEFMPFYVPRPEMPQVDAKDQPAMVATAYTQAKTPTFDVRDLTTLHAHQRIDHAKAKAMDDAHMRKPIIVSNDGFILDGNHRWWANQYKGNKLINVIELDLDFADGLDWLLAQPFTYKIAPTTPERS